MNDKELLQKIEQLEQEIAALKEALNESVKTSVAKDIREASSDIYALRSSIIRRKERMYRLITRQSIHSLFPPDYG